MRTFARIAGLSLAIGCVVPCLSQITTIKDRKGSTWNCRPQSAIYRSTPSGSHTLHIYNITAAAGETGHDEANHQAICMYSGDEILWLVASPSDSVKIQSVTPITDSVWCRWWNKNPPFTNPLPDENPGSVSAGPVSVANTSCAYDVKYVVPKAKGGPAMGGDPHIIVGDHPAESIRKEISERKKELEKLESLEHQLERLEKKHESPKP
jgi:hypothetical protein